MRIFLTKPFARFVRRERIADRQLRESVERAERGLIDADLGAGVIKQRLARQGQGRSGGYRVLIAWRKTARAVFLFGFAKSARGNIDEDELATAREIAQIWLDADRRALARALADGIILEIANGDEEES
ncbi:MAG: type II toxin-antitoxin system RelE/ParE family toxin [Rhodopseudomonas palustris]|uniref:Type II toxin-antitoxin system RelE/ParE family toxin n=1 Tax=Rhodopseudomonas palustris TaxID=1076 RepID=A0A933RWG1_RHOPL|nr:type II toxin-antitoxin system RelE/ParE family toxin [Rhodopseudomonas palustris]